MTRTVLLTFSFAVTLALIACTKDAAPAGGGATHEAPPASNRIDIPPAVRENLGITFARVESRRVSVTRRYPGRFERLPQSRREYHVSLPGRVELLVNQYDTVKAGQPLARIDSPQWRELQQKLASEVTAIDLALKRLDALRLREKAVAEHGSRNEEIIAVWKARETEVSKLIAAGGGGAAELADARGHLAEALKEDAKVHEEQAELAESRIVLESELARYRQTMPLLYAQATGQLLNVEAVNRSFDVAFAHAASVTGYSVSELIAPAAGNESLPLWRALDRLELRTAHDGVVEATPVTHGAWAETGTLVLSTIDPGAIRFRAVVPQSDLTFLHDGQTARILPPSSRNGQAGEALPVTLSIGLEADADQRTIQIIAEAPSRQHGAPSKTSWARAGVSTQIEIITNDEAQPELAIPVESVIQDGLTHVIFRRDPRDANKVIRLEGDLGVSDGRWIVIKSGVREGDEVVLQGVYELKLASSQTSQLKGGHFHADGTWHPDGAPEP